MCRKHGIEIFSASQLGHYFSSLLCFAVLNKIDLVDETGNQTAHAWVTGTVPNVRVVEAVHGQVPLERLFDIGGAAELSNAENARRSVGFYLTNQQQF